MEDVSKRQAEALAWQWLKLGAGKVYSASRVGGGGCLDCRRVAGKQSGDNEGHAPVLSRRGQWEESDYV